MKKKDNSKYVYNKWLWKDSGNITVSANNKTYTIRDIDYNKDFKILKQKLENDFYINQFLGIF